MVFADSAWNYQSLTLFDPAGPPGTIDSIWNYAFVTLVPPSGSGDSVWSRQTVEIRPPHQPVAVWNGTALEFSRVLAWDGSTAE